MLRSLATVSLLLASAACARDHSALAADDGGAGGRGGGSSTGSAFLVSQGAGGDGGGGGETSTSPAGSGGSSDGGGGGAVRPDEPDGPPRLVVVHGVPDRERVAVCFASLEGAGVDVAPFPTEGLAYATAAVASAELLPEQGDVLVVLVASELDDLSDLRCDVLLADPSESPEIERFLVGAVPRSAIDAPRVLVLAMAGCLGGEGHEGEAAEAVCGVGYAPQAPTTSLVVGTPSRLAVPGRVGLQAISASLPTAPFDVQVGHDDGQAPGQVAEGVSLGATLPYPPWSDLDAIDLAPAAQLVATATLPDEDVELADVDLGAAIARANLAALEDGETYALVFVGPAATIGEGPWWRGFDVAVVPTR